MRLGLSISGLVLGTNPELDGTAVTQQRQWNMKILLFVDLILK